MRTLLSSIAACSLAALLFSAAPARAQLQGGSGESVAEAARQARAQKKGLKPVKTLTDDDLAQQKLAALAAASAQADSSAKQSSESQGMPSSARDSSGALSPQEISKKEAELADLKKRLAAAQKDLDLQKREFTLQNDQFYSSPNYSRDTAGKAHLDALQAAIADKEQEVDRLKAQAAELQELVNRAKPAAEQKPAAPPPT